jgi:FtsZ-interacting cell division protein ZipA
MPIDMNTLVAILAAVIVVLLVLLVWSMGQRRKSAELREKFGPEYSRTLEETGDRRKAEQELAAREKRVQSLDIHPLTAEQSNRFAQSWRDVQASFVDDPQGSVREADRLVTEVMNARGYPMGNFEQRAADISVDHPDIVENYRGAHDIALRSGQSKASTEDLRHALVYYRNLFNELLASEAPESNLKEAA